MQNPENLTILRIFLFALHFSVFQRVPEAKLQVEHPGPFLEDVLYVAAVVGIVAQSRLHEDAGVGVRTERQYRRAGEFVQNTLSGHQNHRKYRQNSS